MLGGIGCEGVDALTSIGSRPSDHPWEFVDSAILHTWLPWDSKAREGVATFLLASLQHHIHHPLKLVLSAECPCRLAWVVTCCLFGAIWMLAMFVSHINHALLDMGFAEQPPRLPCTNCDQSGYVQHTLNKVPYTLSLLCKLPTCIHPNLREGDLFSRWNCQAPIQLLNMCMSISIFNISK